MWQSNHTIKQTVTISRGRGLHKQFFVFAANMFWVCAHHHRTSAWYTICGVSVMRRQKLVVSLPISWIQSSLYYFWVPVEQDFLVIIFRAAQFLDLLCLHTLLLQTFNEIEVSVSQTCFITFDDWFCTLLCRCIFESNGTRSSCSLKCQCFASCFVLLDSFSPAGESLYQLLSLFGLCLFDLVFCY